MIAIEREKLEQVLEALTYCEALNRSVQEQKMQAVTSIKEALAQRAEQEPVGIVGQMPGSEGGFTLCAFAARDVPVGTKLYTGPQPKPLTDELFAAAFGVKREAIKICEEAGYVDAAKAIKGLLAVNVHVEAAHIGATK